MHRNLLYLALAGAAPMAGGADTAPPAPVVTIQGSAAAYDARRDDTAARIVVGRADLTRFGDASVSDVLKRQPGITVDAGGAIAMRGLGKGYTQILLDGDRVPAGFSLDSLDPDLIERIEIIRVPTAELRNEAIAGTVNIVLRKAGRRSQRNARLQAMRVGGRPGGLGSVQMSEPGARLSWELAGQALYSNQKMGWRSRSTGTAAAGQPDLLRDGGFEREWRGRQLTLTPSAGWKFDNGDTLALRTLLVRSIADRDGRGWSTTLLGQPQAVATERQLSEDRNTSLRAGLEWAHKLAADASLTLKLNLTRLEQASELDQQGADGAGRRSLEGRMLSHSRERNLKNSGRHAHRLDDAHALVVGWDAERSSRRQQRRQRIRFGEAAPQVWDSGLDATIDQLALYLQDEWTPVDRLALYLGARAERIAVRSEAGGIALSRRSDAIVSPSAQLLWKLPGTGGRQLRLGLSRTFKAPAAAALAPRPYTATNNSALDPDQRGNPELRPELALGLDAAYERHWTGGAMFSLGGYLRRVDGVSYEALAFEQGRWVKFPRNGGRARLGALEFDARFKLADLLAGAPKLDLRFNLTRNWSSRADLPGPDDRVAEQLRLSGTVGADYQPSPRFATGASFSYKRGGQVRVALARHLVSGSRRELDAYARLAIKPGLKLRLSVSNALGDDETSGSRVVDAGALRQVVDIRSMPPTLRAALEWSR